MFEVGNTSSSSPHGAHAHETPEDTPLIKSQLRPTLGLSVEFLRQRSCRIFSLESSTNWVVGPDNLDNLRKLAELFQKKALDTIEDGKGGNDDDDVPDLVPGETFEAAATEEFPAAAADEEAPSASRN